MTSAIICLRVDTGQITNITNYLLFPSLQIVQQLLQDFCTVLNIPEMSWSMKITRKDNIFMPGINSKWCLTLFLRFHWFWFLLTSYVWFINALNIFFSNWSFHWIKRYFPLDYLLINLMILPVFFNLTIRMLLILLQILVFLTQLRMASKNLSNQEK